MKMSLKKKIKLNKLYLKGKWLKRNIKWVLFNKNSDIVEFGLGERLYNYWVPDDRKVIPREDRINETIDLSIIIPVYNQKDYIKECVESVLRQRKKYRVQVVIVDDGSTDGSENIVEKYKGVDDVVVVNKENGGLSSARNVGMRYAVGKYLMFLDSDDYLGDGCINDMMSVAYSSGSDIVQCNWSDLIGKEKYSSGWKPERKVYYKYLDMCEVPGHAAMKVFKRSLWSGVYFPENFWYEDTIIHLIIFTLCSKLTVVDVPYYVYRRNEKGITQTRKNSSKCLDMVFVMDKILVQMIEKGIVMDKNIFHEILYHHSVILLSRVSHLDEDVLKVVFSYVSDRVKDISKDIKDVYDEDKYILNAFLSRDFYKWRLYSETKVR